MDIIIPVQTFADDAEILNVAGKTYAWSAGGIKTDGALTLLFNPEEDTTTDPNSVFAGGYPTTDSTVMGFISTTTDAAAVSIPLEMDTTVTKAKIDFTGTLLSSTAINDLAY